MAIGALCNVQMDWGASIPALTGALIGGGSRWLCSGSQMGDRRPQRSRQRLEPAAAQIERDREHLRALHERVSEDVAWIRGEVNSWSAEVNVERAAGLEPLSAGMAEVRLGGSVDRLDL